jgi:hypothetical protein
MLFEGVREAFIEMRRRNDRPGGAVCLNGIGRYWTAGSSANQRTGEILRQNKLAAYTLKKARKSTSRS